MTPKDPAYFLSVIQNLRKDGYSSQTMSSALSDMEEWLIGQSAEQQIQDKPTEVQPTLSDDRIFRQIVDNASIGIAVFAKENMIYANQKLMDVFQRRGYVVKADSSNFLCHYASARTMSIMGERDKLMELGIETLEPFIGEFTMDDGQKMFMEIHSKALSIGTRIWKTCFLLDVTDKLHARIELDQRIHRFESIINGTDAGTWEWNLIEQQGIYNDRWAEMMGYDLDELRKFGNNTWEALVHPDDAQMVNDLIADLVIGKIDLLKFEARAHHKDGHWVWVLTRGRITDWTEDGQPMIISGANIDITDKKAAEARLVLAKDELEQSLKALSIASQAKEDFLSTMSHEIRTPLNAVIGLANLLLRRNPRPDQLEVVKVLKNSGDNLLHLVNDILDYNKIQAGKFELEFIRFNFRQFLEHLYSTFKYDAHDRGIDLQVKADSQIPDILEGDVTRLNQILINLVGNALKFTKKGKVSLDVSLMSIENGDVSVKFVVTDSGVGIHPSRLEKIFEPFNQSDASISRQFGGTGLGLSIIKALVTMFEGTIEVSSIPGRGSSFTVTLKLKEQSSLDDEAWVDRWELPFKARKMHILYVEDVASNRFLVSNLMDEFNLKCTIAASGPEALEKTVHERYDVILMDIQMPGMDGYQTAENISKQPNGLNVMTPIIAFTAEPVTESLKAKLNARYMRDVISKPFDISQFIEKISLLAGETESIESYSLELYDRTAVAEKSNRIYGLIATELIQFIDTLRTSYSKKDIQLLRAETHKLRPILKNLKMNNVVRLVDQLRDMDSIQPPMVDLISTLELKTAPLISLLRKKVEADEKAYSVVKSSNRQSP